MSLDEPARKRLGNQLQQDHQRRINREEELFVNPLLPTPPPHSLKPKSRLHPEAALRFRDLVQGYLEGVIRVDGEDRAYQRFVEMLRSRSCFDSKAITNASAEAKMIPLDASRGACIEPARSGEINTAPAKVEPSASV